MTCGSNSVIQIITNSGYFLIDAKIDTAFDNLQLYSNLYCLTK